MITIKALNYAYKQPLFETFDLLLKPGSVYGLLGKNGAGKTTLLKLIAGLLFPKSGEIKVMQHVPKKRQVAFLQEIYFLPDTFSLPNIRITDFLNAYTPFYPRFNQIDYEAARDAFELDDSKKLQALSHGQQKKFLLAFGFATHTKLLLLDEPTNALDIPSKQQFKKLVKNHQNNGRTVIISTHQVKDIESLIDTILILDEGKLLFHAPYEATPWIDLENLFIRVLNEEASHAF